MRRDRLSVPTALLFLFVLACAGARAEAQALAPAASVGGSRAVASHVAPLPAGGPSVGAAVLKKGGALLCAGAAQNATQQKCRVPSNLEPNQILFFKSLTLNSDGSFTFSLGVGSRHALTCGKSPCPKEPGNVDGVTYFIDQSVNVRAFRTSDSCGLNNVTVVPNTVGPDISLAFRVKFQQDFNVTGKVDPRRRAGFANFFYIQQPGKAKTSRGTLTGRTDPEQ